MNLDVETAVPAATLALIGGGEFSFGETREIDELLLARMPANNRRVAFLPTASGSGDYATHFGAYLRGIDAGIEVLNVPIYRGRDARRGKNIDAILQAGLVYLGGGVTNALLETLMESPAEMALREAASGGTPIAAIGAAASCFGTWSRNMRSPTPLPGLGWIREAVVETSFDPENDTHLRRMMSMPDVRLGLGIPARTALVLGADGRGEIAGSGQIAAFRKQRQAPSS